MILVTGATGKIGSSLVGELTAQDTPVRALTRDQDKAQSLRESGIDAVVGDLANPDDAKAAIDGVEAAFLLTAQHPEQAVFQGNLVEAAREAGVARVVKLSAGNRLTAEDAPSWVGRLHWQTEQQIKDSGVGYTFLRPNYFMQNLIMMAEPVRGGTLPLPFGDQRVAMIDVRDIAAVAARVLTDDGQHNGQVYDLSGPEALTGEDVAEQLGRGLGRELERVDPPADALVERLRDQGAPDWLQQHFRELVDLLRDGAMSTRTDTVEATIGRPPRSVDVFARDHAQAFS